MGAMHADVGLVVAVLMLGASIGYPQGWLARLRLAMDQSFFI